MFADSYPWTTSFKGTIFQVKQSVRFRAQAFASELMRTQRLSNDQLFQLNWRKRRSLLQFAYERVPFYRARLVSMGAEPGDFCRPEQWGQFPLLTKEDVRCHYHELLASGVPTRYQRRSTTGGSTGRPLRVLHDTRSHSEALAWRTLSWWGVNPGEDAAYVWRSVREKRFERFANRVLWWPTRRIFLDASRLDERSMREFLRSFNSVRPSILQGYTGALEALARFVEENGAVVHAPKAIWTTSSPLNVVQRRLLQSVFDAPVYDQYGCCEVHWLAAECKAHTGLHVFSDARHLEILDDQHRNVEDGVTGEIAVTDLENRVFPLIRYLVGDRGNYLKCPCTCGVTLPLLAPVAGRTTDCFRLPSGAVIAGDYLTALFDDVPEAVRAFQVRQASDYSVELRVIPSPLDQRAEVKIEQVRASLSERMGGGVPVRTVVVSDIPSDRGKRHFVISDLKRPSA